MIHVTCALIEREGLVLAAQRSGSMRLPWKWEFPGGKLEAGETLETCIVREIREELDLSVRVTGALTARTHINKKGMEVCLHPFLCVIEGGEMTLKEHAQIRWISPGQFEELDWSEADIPVYQEYLTLRGK
ncbi:MAG: (deoxy)nucleoside triphosphate pyrophosphohydrolase [Saprospiraceae bacterium]